MGKRARRQAKLQKKIDREMREMGLDPERQAYETMAKSDEGPHDKHFIQPVGVQATWHLPVSWCFCRPRIAKWDRMNNIRVYIHNSITH